LAGLPGQAAPDAIRDTGCGHGGREIRALKILTVSTGIDFPHAAQAIQVRRHRHIENQIRWIRDVTCDKDRSQIRTGTGPHVMAALCAAGITAPLGLMALSEIPHCY
jgi:UDP-3-O-acyl-N-acetylglucosamine deacetylase